MKLLVKVDLIGKPRMTQRDKWKHRKCVDRYYAIKDILKFEAIKQNYKLADDLLIIICLPMPKSWSIKKRNMMIGKPHQQKPDLDNLVKTLLDCLSDKDQTVHTFTASKIWGHVGLIEITNIESSK